MAQGALETVASRRQAIIPPSHGAVPRWRWYTPQGVFPRAFLLVLGVILLPATALARGPLPTVVMPSSDDKTTVKLAEHLELGLESDENVLVKPRDGLSRALDANEPYSEVNLARALANAKVDVLVRVLRVGEGKAAKWQVVVHDRDGLDIITVEVGALKSPQDAKKAAARAADKLYVTFADWEDARKERKARKVREDEEARRQAAAAQRKKPLISTDEEPTEPRTGERTVLGTGDDEDIPPPPAEEDPPRKPAKPPKQAAVEDEEATPFLPREEPRRRSRVEEAEEPAPKPAKKPARRKDPDEPADDVLAPPPDADDGESRRRKPPPKKPARKPTQRVRRGLLDADPPPDEKKHGPVEEFARNLYTLQEPIPYFLISVGPEISAWSYTLRDATLKRRSSTCSPTYLNVATFNCIPHGGANLWVEAWPIRYFGFDFSTRGAGTVYPAARSARTGRPVTQPAYMVSVLTEAHFAAKARFVLTFGPVKGAALGGRVRVGYSRNTVARQTPFIAVPGYHAYHLGFGPEGYLPLLWKRLSFDVRAEFLPLVRYQELAGYPDGPLEAFAPTPKTLSNPGREAIAMGYRVDATVRGTVLAGFFAELRGFSEGFGVLYNGAGSRTDLRGNPISRGRVQNMTFGLTLGVGWLFPQGLAPIYGTW